MNFRFDIRTLWKCIFISFYILTGCYEFQDDGQQTGVCTVIYDANGGTGNVPADGQTYASGASVTILDNTGNLEKAHYQLAGWNTQADGNGTSYSIGAVFTINSAAVTLYAVWLQDFLKFRSSGTNIVITGYTPNIPQEDLVIPGGVTGIGSYAFERCSSLRHVTLPPSVSVIDYDAFYYSSLTGITIQGPVAKISMGAFACCGNMTSVTLPSSVIRIETDAFYNCWNLKNITIPPGVTYIGRSAFQECSLTSIAIPSSVTSIDVNAFHDCSNLTKISVDGANLNYASVNGALLNHDKTVLLQVPGGMTGDYTIPASVSGFGPYIFEDSWKLSNILVDSGNPTYKSVGGVVFSSDMSTLVRAPGRLIGSYTIPAQVTVIGDRAFACCGMTGIIIPSNIHSIGKEAFYFCQGLNSVEMQDGVRSIGAWAFVGSALTAVTIPASVTNIGDSAFWFCRQLADVTCNAISPPALPENSSAFNICAAAVQIRVPSQSVNAYKTATGNSAGWKEYANIIVSQ
jgi:hypothetical protein